MYVQDELAQRDRKHRDKYTRDNKRHLEGVETITRTGETDQGVTIIAKGFSNDQLAFLNDQLGLANRTCHWNTGLMAADNGPLYAYVDIP